jgi:hypothetical protein
MTRINRVLSPDKTTLVVSKELRDELAKLGTKDDSFEDILWRLIKQARVIKC